MNLHIIDRNRAIWRPSVYEIGARALHMHTTALVVAALLVSAPIAAQQSTGTLAGRVVDQQGASAEGATISARNPQTGFVRTARTDSAGVYQLAALPAAVYDVTVDAAGFAPISQTNVDVAVAQTQTIDFVLRIAVIAAEVTVTGNMPLTDVTASSVGGTVDPARVQGLPLNGRQFANLAATLPGVGLGLHSDPTKGTNYAPLINGGAGRNINYQIDGGDNNDDTTGGLLQQFPLEAVQEFRFETERFKAEHGRSNGGVMNVVTKSGTNQFQATLFEMFRDDAMNAVTTTEALAARNTSTPPRKGEYGRHQFGGSFGGPLMMDRAHFFFALERTQQDTTQTVNTKGVFPAFDGVHDTPLRENLGTVKVSAMIDPSQYMTVRYGRNTNRFVFNPSPATTPDNWADANNRFNSVNVNYNWVLSGSRLNETIFQYSDYRDRITARTDAPNVMLPNGMQTGANLAAPQSTEQVKYQFRDDFSWRVTGRGGLGHQFKAGVNFINEPRLFIENAAAKGVIWYQMFTNDPQGLVQTVTLSDGEASVNIPTKQLGLYVQDDWRVGDRVTVNAGVRYDLVTGLNFDQSQNPNFVNVQAAARAGRLDDIVGLENFDLEPRSDRNNVQPRIGAVYDVTGNGTDVVRGGWGIYTDFGYTNSNGLIAALDASGSRFGPIFTATNPKGLRNSDGTPFRVGDPLGNLTGQNEANTSVRPLIGFWVDPRLQQPYQIQTNAGWSHEVGGGMTLSVDYVNSLGRDLNFKPRLNQRIFNTTTRRISARLDAPLNPNTSNNRPALSRGRSRYDALILAARRRFADGFDFLASYTLSKGVSNIGNAADELNTANIQNPDDPFDNPVQFGPNVTTDARHRVTLSAIVALPYGFRLAPIYMYRSALPIFLIDGRDLNGDGERVEIPDVAFSVAETNATTGVSTLKSIGPCETVNCGRGWSQSQLNLRVSRMFTAGGVSIEAIGEVFNVFNAANPSNIVAGVAGNRTVYTAAGDRDLSLLQPTSFSGESQRHEQRVGQIGLRFSF
jgi:hypothetical protein